MSYLDGKKIIQGTIFTGLCTGLCTGIGYFLKYRFKVSKADQFLVRTGLGIKDMLISKKGIQYPFQKYEFIDMKPLTYEFDLHNMSSEKVEFKLPVVFTVAPINPNDDINSFKNYARRMSSLSQDEISEVISGMVEGEARGLTAKMTIEQMFSEKDTFKEVVVDKIDADLRQFGLRVHNANIKEMSDFDQNNRYFEYRKKRAIETANYEAQVEVSKAKRDGEIGVAKNEGETRIATAEIERDATIKENEREMVIANSNAELKRVEAEAYRVSEVARIEAEQSALIRKHELEKDVALKKKEEQLENKRANIMTLAIVESEAIERKADAELYAKNKEAEGVYALYKAKADGLNEIRKAANSERLAEFYYGVDSGLYKDLAVESSKAVQGMEPKVHLWKTGSDAFDKNTLLPITKMMQNFAPGLDGINETIKLPEWMPKANIVDEKK